MKKSFTIISIVAAAAIAFTGCTKSETKAPETFTHTVTIDVNEPISRTVIDDSGEKATFSWSSDDGNRFAIKENEVAGTNVILTIHESGMAKLSADFETETASKYIYKATLAGTRTPSGSPKIPAAQTSSAVSYDPDADVLVSETLEFDDVQSNLNMRFARPVVINKMTLKGLDEGESISMIRISSDKNIIGYYSDNSWTSQGSEITLSTSQTVPSSGQITVYFVTMPVNAATLTVSVVTANYTYSKTFGRTIDFKENEVTVFGVSDLNKAARDDFSGDYAIINSGKTSMMGKWDGNGNKNNIAGVSVEESGNLLLLTEDGATLADSKYTVVKIASGEYEGMYTIQDIDDRYLYAASSSANQLKAKDNADVNCYWTITNTNGSWSIVASKSSNHNVMQFNPNSGNPIFACYSSAGQTAISLFPWASVTDSDSRTAVSLSFAPENPEAITYGDSFTEPTLTTNPANAPITYSVVTVPASGVASIDPSNGDLTITAAGTITVTATVSDEVNYKPASASYTLTVNAPADPTKTYYVKVTSAPSDWSGQYLIVYEDGNLAFNGGLSTLDATGNTISVSISNSKIESNATTDAAAFTIAPVTDGYSIRSASGHYIGRTANSNGFNEDASTAYVNTLAITDGKAIVTSSGGPKLQYYLSGDNSRFRYYSSNQKAIQLYRLEDNREALSTPTGLAVSGKVLSWNAVSEAASYQVTVGETSSSVNTNSYTFTGTDDYYDVSVVAVPTNTTTYKNSEAATLSDAKFGTPTLTAPVLSAGVLDETSVQATWTLNAKATNGYHAVIKVKGNDAEVDSDDVTTGSVTFDGLSSDTEYTVFVYAKAVSGEKAYAQSSTASIDLSTQAATTIADVIAGGGSGTFAVGNVTVFAAPTTSTAIIGDATGKVLLYTGNNNTAHNLSAGDVINVSGSTTLYNGIVEFSTTSFSKTGSPTTPVHGDATALTSDNLTSWVTTPEIVYISGKGKQSGRNISVFGKTLYLNAAQDATNNQFVEFTGYLYGWSTNYTNFSFIPLSISAASDAPTFGVSPTSKQWEYNETNATSFTVTATNGSWDYSPKTLSWASVSLSGNVITVTPNGNNTSTTDDNTGTITVTFSPSYAGYSVEPISISLTQKKQSSGGGDETIVYTLTPASGTNNSYGNNCDITIDNITWNLTGNSQMQPWRIGGAKKDALTEVDRALCSKTALGYNISKIDITHGATAYLTVNSMTVIVSKNSDFSSPISTLTPTFAANNTVTVNRPNGVDWDNCYFKIVYNVTKTNTSNAGYLQFTKAEFTGN